MAVCRLGVLALLLVSLWGCGYRPLGAEPPDSQVRPTLAIPLFANRSTEVGLEAIFATALINAFAQTGAVKVVPGDREADLVLEGKVRSRGQYLGGLRLRHPLHGAPGDLEGRVDPAPEEGRQGPLEGHPDPPGRLRGGPNYHLGEATRTEGIQRAAVTLARRVLDKVLLVI